MSWTKRIVYIAGVIAIGFLCRGYFLANGDQLEKPTYSHDEIRIKPVKVQTKEAFTGELIRYITANGLTEAKQEIIVRPLLTAQVTNVLVQEGQYVPKGKLLVQLDEREYRIMLKEANSSLLNAQIEYGLLKQEKTFPREGASAEDSIRSSRTVNDLETGFQEAQRKYRAGKITLEELEQAEREYQTALVLSGKLQDDVIIQNSGLAAAEAQVARMKYGLQNCRIVAPFNGIVGDIDIHAGDMVTINQELMRLVDLQKLKLKLSVLEAELGFIKVGEVIRATFPAFPDTVFEGVITGINPRVNSETRTGTIIASLQNPQRLLKSGMFATVRITVNRYPDRLLVPREAVIERDQRKLVFIVREGKAFWCYVETGLENNNFIEIKSSAHNLKPGEPVIYEGHFALAHNAPVIDSNEETKLIIR